MKKFKCKALIIIVIDLFFIIYKKMEIDKLSFLIAFYSFIIFALITVVLIFNSNVLNWAIFGLSLFVGLAGLAAGVYYKTNPSIIITNELVGM
jgi:hypothetical protein